MQCGEKEFIIKGYLGCVGYYVNHMTLFHPLSVVLSLYWKMAFFRRQGVAQAFRNNRQLQQFVLTDVTPTGNILGTGSYGSVEEVSLVLQCKGTIAS